MLAILPMGYRSLRSFSTRKALASLWPEYVIFRMAVRVHALVRKPIVTISLRTATYLWGWMAIFHINFWTGGRAWLNRRVTRIRSKGRLSLGFLRYAIERPIKVFNETITGALCRA